MQNTDQETKRLMSRLESTEQRQQQMMAFLAKAVQNPAFLQELLNQRQAQRISGPDKSESLALVRLSLFFQRRYCYCIILLLRRGAVALRMLSMCLADICCCVLSLGTIKNQVTIMTPALQHT